MEFVQGVQTQWQFLPSQLTRRELYKTNERVFILRQKVHRGKCFGLAICRVFQFKMFLKWLS